jgi:hypothetical protein
MDVALAQIDHEADSRVLPGLHLVRPEGFRFLKELLLLGAGHGLTFQIAAGRKMRMAK